MKKRHFKEKQMKREMKQKEVISNEVKPQETISQEANSHELRSQQLDSQEVKPTEMKSELILQYGENEWTQKELEEAVKESFLELGSNESIETMKLYVKPEDAAAYYVINETHTGKIEL